MHKRQKQHSTQNNTESSWSVEARLNQWWQPQVILHCDLPTYRIETETLGSSRCLATKTREIHSNTKGPGIQIQVGPGDISPGTPSIIFLCICIDHLQSLTDSGPTYRRISKHKKKHTHRKLISWLKALQTGGPCGLGGSCRPRRSYVQIMESPQNQLGDHILNEKAECLYSYTTLQTWTLHLSKVLEGPESPEFSWSWVFIVVNVGVRDFQGLQTLIGWLLSRDVLL